MHVQLQNLLFTRNQLCNEKHVTQSASEKRRNVPSVPSDEGHKFVRFVMIYATAGPETNG